MTAIASPPAKPPRHITQFYDQFLAPSGLRTTQFSVLARLSRLRPITINTLATDLVVDRTTLGRNILPLERDGLITVEKGSRGRRSKELRLTKAGAARFRAATKGWTQAQRQFVTAFGAKRTADLRRRSNPISAPPPRSGWRSNTKLPLVEDPGSDKYRG